MYARKQGYRRGNFPNTQIGFQVNPLLLQSKKPQNRGFFIMDRPLHKLVRLKLNYLNSATVPALEMFSLVSIS